MRRIFAAAAVLLIGLAVLGQRSTPAQAASIQVTTLADSGSGSLRAAITTANLDATPDVITFTGAAASGTITLLSNLPSITTDITIQGPGASSLTIDALTSCANCGVLNVSGLTAALTGSGFTVKGTVGIFTNTTTNLTNVAIINSPAGGLQVFSGTTTVTGSTISGNSNPGNGAGITVTNGATLNLTNSTVSNNIANTDGGGLWVSTGANNVTITNSTFSGNNATGRGGAIFIDPQGSGSPVTNIFESTISGNTSGRGGGGIFSGRGTLNLRNDTISGNTTALQGGGGIALTGGTMTSTNLTIVNNSVNGAPSAIVAGFGAGVQVASTATGSFRNTILSNNADNCQGVITSLGNNLASDATCNLSGTGDQSSTNPLLGALANNGGPTLTHLPQTGSPAIDRGSNTGCPSTDQRGITRPQDSDNNGTATCEIGAVEIAGVTTPPPPVVVPGAPSAPPVVIQVAQPQPTPVIPVFQNSAAGAVFNPIAKTPTPRPAVAAAPPVDPNAIAGIPNLRPPNTGDAGLKALLRDDE